jgi:uncharacterized OB-fold protein
MAESKASSQAPGDAFAVFLKEGELRLQVCGACGKQVFFPRTACPYCGDGGLEWRKASGRGTVYSTTVVRQRPDRGGDYNVAIVELAEGARMMSRVEGVAPGDVQIGMAVTASIAEANGAPIVVFRPAIGASR